MFDLKTKALILATKAHNGQMRKISNLPYIIHPIRVAAHVSKLTLDEEVIASAYLHDVLEDTTFDIDDFPENVKIYVKLLTKDKKETKEEAIMKASIKKESLMIKLCDRYDNLTDRSDFLKNYSKRKDIVASTQMILNYAKDFKLDDNYVYYGIKEAIA